MMTSDQRSREDIACDVSFVQTSWRSNRKARNKWGGEEGKSQYLNNKFGMHFGGSYSNCWPAVGMIDCKGKD
jgi:hypothetical protein